MKTFAIIPAAGKSSRMGCSKLLLPWHGSTVIEHVLEIWQQSGVDERIVVVSEEGTLAATCRAAGAVVCVPSVAPTDMKESIQLGLAHAQEKFHPSHQDAWLVAPADMPWLSARLIGSLIEAFVRSGSPVVAPRTLDGRLGHPVLFSWRLAAELPKQAGTLKDLLERHKIHFVEHQQDEDFQDIDTWNDYRRLHNRHDPSDPI